MGGGSSRVVFLCVAKWEGSSASVMKSKPCWWKSPCGSTCVEGNRGATVGDGTCDVGGAETFGVVGKPMGNVSSASVTKMSSPWDCGGGVDVVA